MEWLNGNLCCEYMEMLNYTISCTERQMDINSKGNKRSRERENNLFGNPHLSVNLGTEEEMMLDMKQSNYDNI